MPVLADDQFRAFYMSAQSVAYHERLTARGANLLHRSAALLQRSQTARTNSDEILRRVRDYFPDRPARTS